MRIMKELSDNLRDDVGPKIRLADDDLFDLLTEIEGPTDSPYEGHRFRLSIKVPRDYPFRPPVILFDIGLLHPNIRADG